MDFFKHFDVAVRVIGTGINTEDPAILLGIGVLGILLEVWLARRERWWPGLLLPAASFLWTLGGLLISCGMAGDFLAEMGIDMAMRVQMLLMNNLPTLILLVLYGGCRWFRRRKHRRGRELNKTRVDDL